MRWKEYFLYFRLKITLLINQMHSLYDDKKMTFAQINTKIHNEFVSVFARMQEHHK